MSILQCITWMHCYIDKELESKLQIELNANNIHSNAQQHHHEQEPWPSQSSVAAIAGNLKKNGCLNVNVVNRTIPISTVTTTTTSTTTTIISTATCLLLLKASPTYLPLLNAVNSRTNFGIGDTILWTQIHFDCTATIKIFLPLHQQTHCQTRKPTSVTIEKEMIRFVVNGVDSIAQSMCNTNQTKLPTTIKLVEAIAMCATNETVSQTLDQCKAIKFKTAHLRRCEHHENHHTERPNKVIATIANGHRRCAQANYAEDNAQSSGDLMANANAAASVRETSKVAKRRALQTERRHHYSKLPNKFTIVNTLYIEYRKMFCTFLLPLLILLCNLTPLIHAGEYESQLIRKFRDFACVWGYECECEWAEGICQMIYCNVKGVIVEMHLEWQS